MSINFSDHKNVALRQRFVVYPDFWKRRGPLYLDLLIHQSSPFLMEIKTKIYPNLSFLSFLKGVVKDVDAKYKHG